MGVDEMGVDKMGSRRSGNKTFNQLEYMDTVCAIMCLLNDFFLHQLFLTFYLF